MAKQTTMSGDEMKALLVLLRAGYKVTLYKKTDKLHYIERIYSLPTTIDDIDNRMIKAIENAQDKPEPTGG